MREQHTPFSFYEDTHARRRKPRAPPDASTDGSEAADGRLMTIGISVTPGSDEFEMRFLDLWARTHSSADRFVVLAGGEVRLLYFASIWCTASSFWTKLRRTGA
jgi:hypothetical protein